LVTVIVATNNVIRAEGEEVISICQYHYGKEIKKITKPHASLICTMGSKIGIMGHRSVGLLSAREVSFFE